MGGLQPSTYVLSDRAIRQLEADKANFSIRPYCYMPSLCIEKPDVAKHGMKIAGQSLPRHILIENHGPNARLI